MVITDQALVDERQSLLLALLTSEGKVVTKVAAASMGVSEDTIRRDLREMASAGLCRRVYGGALPVPVAQAPYETRETLHTSSKTKVAAAAARLIEPGMTVVLDGGTTALRVARALPAGLEATIVTHSPTVAVELLPKTGIEVVIIGGRLFRHSVVAASAATVEGATRVNADLFLLGATGVSAEFGLTTGDAEEAVVKRTFAQRSAATFVLASVEKIGAASAFQIIPLSACDGVITDAPSDATLASIASVVDVIGA